jgi:hypothetical protein
VRQQHRVDHRRPRQAEFLKTGNAICEKGNQQIGKAANKQLPKTGPKPSKAQLTKFATDTIIPSVQTQINQIEAWARRAGDQAR